MFAVKIEGNFDPIIAAIDRVLAIRQNLVQLGDIIAEDIRQGNEEGLLAGTDKDGTKMPLTVRQSDAALSARFGDGEPLNPKGSSSRSVSDFTVTVEAMSGGAVSVVGRWPNTPFFVYHKGYSSRWNRPARNIVGIRPETRQVIGGHVRQWIEEQIRL